MIDQPLPEPAGKLDQCERERRVTVYPRQTAAAA